MHGTNLLPVVSLRSTTGYCLISRRDESHATLIAHQPELFISPGSGVGQHDRKMFISNQNPQSVWTDLHMRPYSK